jgi:hypothetical protein
MSATTQTSYINAYALYIGSRALGIELTTSDVSPILPIPVCARDGVDSEWLLFTEEASLKRALNGELKGKFLPESFSLEILDNKWEFIEWLNNQQALYKGLRQWPLDVMDQVTYPCLIKAKHSWDQANKLPRGWVCRSRSELEQSLETLRNTGFKAEHYFLQEWLGNENCRVISVCGFHDVQNENRNLTAVVERVAAYSKELSCSAAVAIIEDQWRLKESTSEILNAIRFTGPYEMEYLVSGNKVAVLELNPRFWMQNAIFLVNGNGLLKRYFGMDTEADRRQVTIKNLIWVDSLYLVQSIFKMRFAFLLKIIKEAISRKQTIQFWPSIPMAIYVCVRILLCKVVKRLTVISECFYKQPN